MTIDEAIEDIKQSLRNDEIRQAELDRLNGEPPSYWAMGYRTGLCDGRISALCLLLKLKEQELKNV